MEFINYKNTGKDITVLFIGNNTISINITNNNNSREYYHVITSELIKSNQLKINILFKIIIKCLLNENEKYNISFIDNINYIIMTIDVNFDNVMNFNEQFVINEIQLPLENPIIDLQKQINDIKNENLELKIQNENLLNIINELKNINNINNLKNKVNEITKKTINEIKICYNNDDDIINIKNAKYYLLNWHCRMHLIFPDKLLFDETLIIKNVSKILLKIYNYFNLFGNSQYFVNDLQIKLNYNHDQLFFVGNDMDKITLYRQAIKNLSEDNNNFNNKIQQIINNYINELTELYK
jgi:hypothetical protein